MNGSQDASNNGRRLDLGKLIMPEKPPVERKTSMLSPSVFGSISPRDWFANKFAPSDATRKVSTIQSPEETSTPTSPTSPTEQKPSFNQAMADVDRKTSFSQSLATAVALAKFY